MAMPELTAQLADFALNAKADPEAAKVMRLSLLDWSAVALAGAPEPVARIIRNQAIEEGGREEASIVGGSKQVPARMAAWVNGTTSHALDYDDTHFAHIGHPSVAVVPAALAIAERFGVDMVAFKDACLIGAEASIRVGVWLGRAHYQIGFHQTATAGAFGAALAASRLLKLDQDQTQMALGLVSTQASGLKSQFGTMGKPLNAGLAAQNGVEAALLVSQGFLSMPLALDGPQGFAQTHHAERQQKAFDDLGRKWLFPEVQHKFHACCHGLHAALEALEEAKIDNAAIKHVTIYTHPRWMTVCNIPEPRTGLEAKFSYRMVLAMRLLGYDTARLDSYYDALCDDPNLQKLRQQMDVKEDDALGEMQVRLILEHKDGSRKTQFHDLSDTSDFDIRCKRVRGKAEKLLGVEKADRIWRALSENGAITSFASELRSGDG